MGRQMQELRREYLRQKELLPIYTSPKPKSFLCTEVQGKGKPLYPDVKPWKLIRKPILPLLNNTQEIENKPIPASKQNGTPEVFQKNQPQQR